MGYVKLISNNKDQYYPITHITAVKDENDNLITEEVIKQTRSLIIKLFESSVFLNDDAAETLALLKEMWKIEDADIAALSTDNQDKPVENEPNIVTYEQEVIVNE